MSADAVELAREYLGHAPSREHREAVFAAGEWDKPIPADATPRFRVDVSVFRQRREAERKLHRGRGLVARARELAATANEKIREFYSRPENMPGAAGPGRAVAVHLKEQEEASRALNDGNVMIREAMQVLFDTAAPGLLDGYRQATQTGDLHSEREEIDKQYGRKLPALLRQNAEEGKRLAGLLERASSGDQVQRGEMPQWQKRSRLYGTTPDEAGDGKAPDRRTVAELVGELRGAIDEVRAERRRLDADQRRLANLDEQLGQLRKRAAVAESQICDARNMRWSDL